MKKITVKKVIKALYQKQPVTSDQFDAAIMATTNENIRHLLRLLALEIFRTGNLQRRIDAIRSIANR